MMDEYAEAYLLHAITRYRYFGYLSRDTEFGAVLVRHIVTKRVLWCYKNLGGRLNTKYVFSAMASSQSITMA